MCHTAIVGFCIAAMGMPIIKERGFPHPQAARKERLFPPPPRRRRYPQAEIHGYERNRLESYSNRFAQHKTHTLVEGLGKNCAPFFIDRDGQPGTGGDSGGCLRWNISPRELPGSTVLSPLSAGRRELLQRIL